MNQDTQKPTVSKGCRISFAPETRIAAGAPSSTKSERCIKVSVSPDPSSLESTLNLLKGIPQQLFPAGSAACRDNTLLGQEAAQRTLTHFVYLHGDYATRSERTRLGSKRSALRHQIRIGSGGLKHNGRHHARSTATNDSKELNRMNIWTDMTAIPIPKWEIRVKDDPISPLGDPLLSIMARQQRQSCCESGQRANVQSRVINQLSEHSSALRIVCGEQLLSESQPPTRQSELPRSPRSACLTAERRYVEFPPPSGGITGLPELEMPDVALVNELHQLSDESGFHLDSKGSAALDITAATHPPWARPYAKAGPPGEATARLRRHLWANRSNERADRPGCIDTLCVTDLAQTSVVSRRRGASSRRRSTPTASSYSKRNLSWTFNSSLRRDVEGRPRGIQKRLCGSTEGRTPPMTHYFSTSRRSRVARPNRTRPTMILWSSESLKGAN